MNDSVFGSYVIRKKKKKTIVTKFQIIGSFDEFNSFFSLNYSQ